MRQAFSILFVFALISNCFSQNPAIKSTDAYVASVNKNFNENVLVKKGLNEKSPLGGDVSGYYLKNKLKLIVSHTGDNFSFIQYSFYISNDSLMFVNERKVSLKEPMTEKEYAEFEKYVIFNTDNNGATDHSKWPLIMDINNNYYFSKRKVVKYELKNLNKPVKATEAEIDETTKDLISRYTTHMEELK